MPSSIVHLAFRSRWLAVRGAAAAASLACGLIVLASARVDASTYSSTATRPSVVWITQGPVVPVADAAIHQTNKTFVPDFLVVTVGTSVRFPNDDSFYHSVFSDSPSNPFDFGLYDTGPGKSVTFDQPGIVRVRCHVHGSMHATVIVVDGPYTVTKAANERFTISGLTPGAHTLHVWSGAETIDTTTVQIK